MKRTLEQAAQRLHHLSMRYSGALIELISGKPVGLIPHGHPGLSEARDLIDLILLTRAEINAMTQLMAEKGMIDQKHWREIVAENYEWLTDQKEAFLKVKSTDAGLTIFAAAKDEDPNVH